MGCHLLPQEIFPTQGWNLNLLHLPSLTSRFSTNFATWEALCPRQYIIFLKKLFSFSCLLCFTFHVCVRACVWCVLELCLSVAVWSWERGLFLHQGYNLAPHMVSELMGNLNLRIPCLSGPLRNEAVDPTLPKLAQSCILFGVNLRH